MEPVAVHRRMGGASLVSRGKVRVVILAFGAEQALPVLVPRLVATLQRLGRDFEIILFDDRSSDLVS
jgi:hypothetical protein